MKCPDDIAEPLLEILGISLLRIRHLALAGRANQCAIEADHVHNLPELLRNYSQSLAKFYWETERVAYIRQIPAGDATAYENAWKALSVSISRPQA